jgi:hypothetical protein
MTTAITAFLVVTGAASAVWLLLARALKRRVAPDGSTPGSAGYSADGEGWILASWFGHPPGPGAHHSTDHCGGWDSGNGDSGGGDGAGGAD